MPDSNSNESKGRGGNCCLRNQATRAIFPTIRAKYTNKVLDTISHPGIISPTSQPQKRQRHNHRVTFQRAAGRCEAAGEPDDFHSVAEAISARRPRRGVAGKARYSARGRVRRLDKSRWHHERPLVLQTDEGPYLFCVETWHATSLRYTEVHNARHQPCS